MVAQAAMFTATTRIDGETSYIDMAGEIDGLADEVLSEAYEKVEQIGPGQIVLNFSSVDYINSTGIALIVGVLARARAAGISLAASGLSDHYREIFTITRLSDFMEIQP